MTEPFVSVWDQSVMTPESPPRAIVPSTSAPAWPAAIPDHVGATHPFVNEEQNSRIVGNLSGGQWSQRWERPLTQSLRPAHVLAAAGKVLVQGESIWQLFDREGASIAVSAFGPAMVSLDAERGVFYAPGRAGEIVVRDLSTAAQRFRFALTFGQAYGRVYIARIGDSFVAASVERMMDPHKPDPNASMVEIATLTAQPRIDALVGTAFAPIAAHLYQKSRVLKAASRGTAIVLATDSQLSYADLQLKVRRVFSGEFVPVSLSVDEGGRAYMIVQAGGQRMLWVVTPNGERVAGTPLPESAQSAEHPPIVGYDHSIYVLGSDRIYAFAPDGSRRWESTPGARPAGATVATNGWVIASIGNQVVGFDPTGKPEVLHSFAGEPLATAPILDERGELYVASSTSLFCLSRP